tara:strand:+ start:1383 stop:2537 length:1155 start_codon:yes stop_codon:yes gene_type:complete
MTKRSDAFNNKKMKVPFFYPSITKADKLAIMKALNSPLLTDGPNLKKFELEFGKFCGSLNSIGVSNATSGLFLSLKSLGIGLNDEVIIPDLTFAATASSVIQTGGIPVLADVDDDLNISIESIQKCINRKTKAIIPVHFAGKSCKINDIMKLAKKNNLYVIEDCAHAIGTYYKNKHVGTFGNTGCFSFYPTKNITTIEGGMILTKSGTLASKIKKLRNQGITKSLNQRFSKGKPWEYDIDELGYNFRLDEIRCALGISQLKHLKSFNSKRWKAAKYYYEKLKNVDGIVCPEMTLKNEHSFHLYIIKITPKFALTRDRLFQKLLKNGIRTSVHYKPLHEFSLIKKNSKKSDLKNSKSLYKQILSLPMYPGITKQEQDLVIGNILF